MTWTLPKLTEDTRISPNAPTGATCATVFELTAGADPYFTNIDPAQNNVFYLSQDLRVFKATPGKNNVPVSGGPSFGSDNTAGAFTYITQLISYLNTNFADPSGIDPFSSLLPGQSGALSGDSSVSPVTVDITIPPTFPPIPQINIYNNYNFAVARFVFAVSRSTSRRAPRSFSLSGPHRQPTPTSNRRPPL